MQRFYVVMQNRAGVRVNSCDEIDNAKGAAQMCKALNMDAEADEAPHYMVELRHTGRIIRVGFD